MTLRITDTVIMSDHATAFAWPAADGSGAWIVAGKPGRLFTRDQAIAEVTAAEQRASGHLSEWDAELGE